MCSKMDAKKMAPQSAGGKLTTRHMSTVSSVPFASVSSADTAFVSSASNLTCSSRTLSNRSSDAPDSRQIVSAFASSPDSRNSFQNSRSPAPCWAKLVQCSVSVAGVRFGHKMSLLLQELPTDPNACQY